MYSIDWARIFSRALAGSNQPKPADGTSQESPLTHRVSRLSINRTVWCLGFTSFFTDVSSEMVSSILPIYLFLHLHLSPLAFGTIDGLYQGFAAFARLGGGFLADRWQNHKAVASFGYGLSAFSKLALLAAGNAWGLLAATIAIDRTGKGIRTAPRDAMISHSSDRSTLASAFGVHRALDAAGAMLGPLLAFAVFSSTASAFDVIFVVSFCVAMIGLGIILFLVDEPKAESDGSESTVSLRGAIGLLRIPTFQRLCVAGGGLSLATVSDSFVFLTLQQQIGFSTAYFPLLYVGVASINSLLSVPLGWLADHGGRWRTFLAGHMTLLLVYLALLAPGSGLIRLVLAVGLLGCYYAATDGVLTAMASATLPHRLCGSGLALLVTMTNAARLLASVLFGALWQWSGLTNAILVFSSALIAAIAAAGIVRQNRSTAARPPVH